MSRLIIHNYSGTSQLILPDEWANQKKLYNEIYDLQCSKYEIETSKKPHIKIIHHIPNDLIKISYKVHLTTEAISYDNYYRPIGSNAYFFCIGHGLFIIPYDLKVFANIILDWNSLPKSWVIANSYGTNQLKQDLHLSFSQLQNATFLGGDFELIQCGDSSDPIYIAIRGKHSFTNNEFIDLVENIFTTQRDFWNDHAFPYYLISVIPIDEEHSIGGACLINNFSLFLGTLPESYNNYLNGLACLISHEHFHTWNGYKINFSEPEGSMYWFSEGFTEYYAAKLNFQNGILQLSDYIEHVNNILTEYFTSSVKNETNKTIMQDFWKDPDIERLPYIRGFTLALYLDSKIKIDTSGLHSLDNLMHDLQEKIMKDNIPFSKQKLFSLLSKYISKKDLNSIKQYAIKGKSIPVIEQVFEPEYQLVWNDYLGFDLQKSQTQGVVSGVKYNNIAAKAGLNNGLKFINWLKNGTLITVTVSENNNKIKTITYDLDNITKIPQFVKRV